MKKLLSLILAVSLMMSLFCVVPASAETINTWPYYYEDFEDNASSLSNLTVVENGVNGSGYAAQYTDTTNKTYDDFSFGSTFKGWICNGDTIKFTAKLKLAQEIDDESEARLLFHIAGGSNTQYNAEAYPDGNAWFTVGGSNLNLTFDRTSTDWQTMSYTGVHTGVDVYLGETVAPSIRLIVAESQSFLIDDVEFGVLKENPEETPLDKVIYSNDFETNTNGVIANSTVEATHITNATGDAYKGAGYLRFTDDKTNDIPKMNITLSEALESGVRYYIRFKARYSEAYKTHSYDSSTGYAELESPEALATTEYLRCRIDFGSNTYVNRNVVKNDDTWTEIAFTIQTTRAAALTNVIPVNFWGYFQAGSSAWSGSDTGIIEIDDIFVKKYNGVLNGDGEISKYAHALLDDNTSTGNEATTAGVVGWANASKSPLNQTGSLRSGEGQITAYSTDYGQKTTTTMSVEAGKTYKLTAWGRGSGTNASGDIQFGADYTLSDTTTSSAVIATIEQTKATATTYQYCEGTFTVPENVASAKLYVTMLEAKNENQDTSRLTGTDKNLAMYIDDIALLELPSANVPTVTASATTASGGIVTVAKNTTAPTDVTVTSVVKLTATKNGVKSYIGSATGTVITVPESYYTGYTLAAEITPIGSNGYIGKTVTIEVPAVPVVVGTTFTATAAAGATLESAEAMSGTVIWVAYDTNGKMLDWSSAPMSVTAGGTQTVAVPSDFDASGATEVKVMLWADMIKCVPLADHVAY